MPVKKMKKPVKKIAPKKVKKAVKKVALKMVKKPVLKKKIVKKAQPKPTIQKAKIKKTEAKRKKAIPVKAVKKPIPKKIVKKVLPQAKKQLPKTAEKKIPALSPKVIPVKKPLPVLSPKKTAPVLLKSTPPADFSSGSDVDKDVVLLTEEGFRALKEELSYLTDEKRKDVAKRLKEAISYGDLSENSEYEEAKNEQAFIEGRILELERKIKHAKIIDAEKANVARIGSTVVIVNLKGGEKEEYTIVGSTEADPMGAKISNESPLGSAVLGKKKGDKIVVEAPGGIFHYEIVVLK